MNTQEQRIRLLAQRRYQRQLRRRRSLSLVLLEERVIAPLNAMLADFDAATGCEDHTGLALDFSRYDVSGGDTYEYHFFTRSIIFRFSFIFDTCSVKLLLVIAAKAIYTI